MKWAVLSMDVEDWYHLDYFPRPACDISQSLLDGVEVYLSILREYKIVSSFFVLGELVSQMRQTLLNAINENHEIGSHGWNHVRPLSMSLAACMDDFRRSKGVIEDALGRAVFGYRAPCFSLDDARLQALRQEQYKYDSSRILFTRHPLYGMIKLAGFYSLSQNIHQAGDFFEFQVSTLRVAGRELPVSGGGYLRIFPWMLMERWIKQYLNSNELYVFYIHPFELSLVETPRFPPAVSVMSRFRFGYGRSRVEKRLRCLIRLLKDRGFEFTTFRRLREGLLSREQ